MSRHFRFNRLERMKTGGTPDNMLLSIPLPKSPSGKAYQQCPDAACSPRLFQLGDRPALNGPLELNLTKARRQPGKGETVCPYCGCQEDDEKFLWERDLEHAKKQVMWAAKEDINDMLKGLAGDFNRNTRKSSFLQIRMDVKPARNPRPISVREDLLRDLTCDCCGRNYGVYAIALFCPDCGAPNLVEHFRRESELITRQTELAEEARNKGETELAYRLLGNAHEDVLTAMETILKTVYRHLVRTRLPGEAEELCQTRAIGNAFQNLERGRRLFMRLGVDPYAALSEEEQDFIRLNVEKRHVIGHNLSMADEKFTTLEEGHRPGETIELLAEDILRFADVARKLMTSLADVLAGVDGNPLQDHQGAP